MLRRTIAATVVGLILAACSPAAPVVEDTPRLEIHCPDYTARTKLEAGSTYRDLALSRSEALNGWRRCFEALEISKG